LVQGELCEAPSKVRLTRAQKLTRVEAGTSSAAADSDMGGQNESEEEEPSSDVDEEQLRVTPPKKRKTDNKPSTRQAGSAFSNN
jgi:hypothetical protein